MKLWLLKPVRNLPEDPWDPWFDKVFGFVIRAETEQRAREIANENGGDEVGPISYDIYRTGGDVWLHQQLSTCIELTSDGKEELIIIDFKSA